ncbi:hypothetical protein DFP73DRAFT_524455 [Morchella snyderi]|nr:hypothetical protein DFP73DRAFT_524455 [Morchella snyderi]
MPDPPIGTLTEGVRPVPHVESFLYPRLAIPTYHADVVFIGGDLENGSPPMVGHHYNLVLCESTNRYRDRHPPIGVQLRREGHRCGWIREHDNRKIIELLNEEIIIKGSVTFRQRFEWNDQVCYWAKMEWYIVSLGVDRRAHL